MVWWETGVRVRALGEVEDPSLVCHCWGSTSLKVGNFQVPVHLSASLPGLFCALPASARLLGRPFLTPWAGALLLLTSWSVAVRHRVRSRSPCWSLQATHQLLAASELGSSCLASSLRVWEGCAFVSQSTFRTFPRTCISPRHVLLPILLQNNEFHPE